MCYMLLIYYLISIACLCHDNRVFVEFHSTHFFVKDLQSRTILLQGLLDGGLYKLSLPSDSSDFASSNGSSAAFLSSFQDMFLWHRRLDHPSFTIVRKVLKDCNFLFRSSSSQFCNSCQVAKSHRLSFPVSTSRSVEPFALVYYDLWGPSPIKLINGARYFILFVDDCTKYC